MKTRDPQLWVNKGKTLELYKVNQTETFWQTLFYAEPNLGDLMEEGI